MYLFASANITKKTKQETIWLRDTITFFFEEKEATPETIDDVTSSG